MYKLDLRLATMSFSAAMTAGPNHTQLILSLVPALLIKLSSLQTATHTSTVQWVVSP